MKSKRNFYTLFFPMIFVVLIGFYCFYPNDGLAIGLGIGSIISVLSIVLEKYECQEETIKINNSQLWKAKIHYTRIQKVEKVKHSIFQQLMMAYPATGYKISYNSFDTVIIHPKNEEFIPFLNEKIDAFHS